MSKVGLTPSFIRQATCPIERSKITFFDNVHTGLMLEVRATGRKTFYQRYTDARGKERQFKIGSSDLISVEQARKKGKEVKANAVLGPDPQQRRKELRSSCTFNRFVAERYLPHVKDYKRSWETDDTLLRNHILPAIGHLFLDDIRAEHVADLLKDMRKRGYAVGTTNRVLVLVRYAYNLAIKWEVPGIQKNPTAPLALGAKSHRERFLSHAEARALLQSIHADVNEVAANAILLLLLTGARRNEVTQAKWEYVDWKNSTLLVPISKSGKPRKVTLNGQAMALLRSMKRTRGNPYIFPSPETGRPSSSIYSPWNRIRKRAGLPDVRLHDLRHSFASFLVNAGVSIYAVQKLLGHAYIQTTQRYAHLSGDTLVQAAEAAASYVEEADQHKKSDLLQQALEECFDA